MNQTNLLIGRRFRRDKYGLSTWDDKIQDIYLTYEYVPGGMKPIVNIIDSKGDLFPLSEIVLLT